MRPETVERFILTVNVTKFAQDKTLQSIASGKLTFGERSVVTRVDGKLRSVKSYGIQGYLAHKKQPPPLGPPYDPRHRATVGS